MKTGFENKRKLAILVVLLLVLVGALWYFASTMWGGSSTPAPQAQAVRSATTARETPAERRSTTQTNGPDAKKVASLESLDPTLHPELMAGAESLVYAGTGRNIFSMQSAQPKIERVIAPVRVSQQQQAPQGPPPPPPIDLTFFGYQANNGVKKAFLLHGTDVFIASEGDVVDHHYKIDKINPLSIQVTDLLYNNTQTLPLSQS
ncbi:MAG TPA: hypothetical protein VJV22_15785 [Acidobacteriaceae bacterium]|nr:hypothetical protein [Acidobacteriaceae bacterium]